VRNSDLVSFISVCARKLFRTRNRYVCFSEFSDKIVDNITMHIYETIKIYNVCPRPAIRPARLAANYDMAAWKGGGNGRREGNEKLFQVSRMLAEASRLKYFVNNRRSHESGPESARWRQIRCFYSIGLHHYRGRGAERESLGRDSSVATIRDRVARVISLSPSSPFFPPPDFTWTSAGLAAAHPIVDSGRPRRCYLDRRHPAPISATCISRSIRILDVPIKRVIRRGT